MSLETQRFIASLQLTMPDGTATRYFRDFLAAVDGFIQQAAVISVWGGISGSLSDQTDLQNALNAASLYTPPIVKNEATNPYTLVLSDSNKALRFTAADAAVTIPLDSIVAFAANTELVIRQAGTGTLVLTTTGLTINGTLPTWSQHTELKLRRVAADEWDVVRI